MVESTKKSPAVARAHERIATTLSGTKNLVVNDLDMGDISRQLNKMPEKNSELVCKQTLAVFFDAAAEKIKDDDSAEVLANLRKLVGLVAGDLLAPKPRYLDTMFFPNKKNVDRIAKYISMAKKTLIICIFTLTNDDLAKAVIDRHRNGVEVRVISDDECSQAKGSDIIKLAEAGIHVRTDDAPTYHMHDKFMVVDKSFVMTGSFNWTYQAGSHNQENLAIIDNNYYIEKYTNEFNKLWISFEKNEILRKEHEAATKIQRQYKKTQPKRQAKSGNTAAKA